MELLLAWAPFNEVVDASSGSRMHEVHISKSKETLELLERALLPTKHHHHVKILHF